MAKPAFDVLDEVFSSFRSSNETSDDQEVRKHLKSEEQVEEGHDIAFALSPSPPPSIVTTYVHSLSDLYVIAADSSFIL